MTIRAVPYVAAASSAWNGFIGQARNPHFLFHRSFMEYHSDRFQDFSLIFLDGDRIVALLPANRGEGRVYSHQGLTFGGFVVGDDMTSPRMLACFDTLLEHLRREGIRSLNYKPLPYIYARRPAQEDLYALFRIGAQLIRRDVTTTIDYRDRRRASQRRLRGVKKAQTAGTSYGQSDDWGSYWTMLTEVLEARHKVRPVHGLSEIRLLADRFRDNIRLFVAQEDGHLVAGVVIFETELVAHAQYICASERGREIGALDGLFSHLISSYDGTKRYFDFGISNESGGKALNIGLVTQKEEFGGSAVVHDEYRVDV